MRSNRAANYQLPRGGYRQGLNGPPDPNVVPMQQRGNLPNGRILPAMNQGQNMPSQGYPQGPNIAQMQQAANGMFYPGANGYPNGNQQEQDASYEELYNLLTQQNDVINTLQQLINKQSTQLLSMQDEVSQMSQWMERQTDFPEQFKAGVVAYPDRYPFPMVLDLELLTNEQARYGLTNDMVQALIKVDVDNPTFLREISFDLYKTDHDPNAGVLGAFLPLAATNWNGLLETTAGVTFVYQGRDFFWRVQTSSDDRIWQTGWRSSAMLDFLLGGGYRLPLEYELRRNDSIIIQAVPVAPPNPDPMLEQEYSLTVHLHVYKMLLKQERE